MFPITIIFPKVCNNIYQTIDAKIFEQKHGLQAG